MALSPPTSAPRQPPSSDALLPPSSLAAQNGYNVDLGSRKVAAGSAGGSGSYAALGSHDAPHGYGSVSVHEDQEHWGSGGAGGGSGRQEHGAGGWLCGSSGLPLLVHWPARPLCCRAFQMCIPVQPAWHTCADPCLTHSTRPLSLRR